MGQNLIRKYIWIIDTLTRYGKLTKEDLNNLWVRAKVADGDPLPDRTFFHYRRAIEEIFHVEIRCDRNGHYFIDKEESSKNISLSNWLLDSMALSAAISDSNSPEDRIEIEDVPSAREFLPFILEALNNSEKISFTYAGFSRSRAENNIVFHPYFLKRYKQRWYMIGLKEKSNDIRTYALDRIKELHIVNEKFEMPATITLEQLFSNIVGVTTSKGEIKTVKIKTTTTQAKYFRALPLHPSQTEEMHDDFSIFTYRLKLNYELAHELLGLGNAVRVLEPPELKAMVVSELKAALEQYGG